MLIGFIIGLDILIYIYNIKIGNIIICTNMVHFSQTYKTSTKKDVHKKTRGVGNEKFIIITTDSR